MTENEKMKRAVKPELRIAILAHGLRVAGGLSVGLNLIGALGRAAPQHKYYITVPAGLGYEKICSRIPDSEIFVHENSGGIISRLFFENFRLPKIIRKFNPDVIFATGNFGLQNPSCPQAVLVHLSHLFYPSKYYGKTVLESKVKVRYQKRAFARQLKNTQHVFCQTSVIEERLKNIYHYNGKTSICPNAVSTFAVNSNEKDCMPEKLIPYKDKMKLLCLTKFYPHKNLESVVKIFHEYTKELDDVVCILTISPDQHPNAARLLRSIEQNDLSAKLINVGPLDQTELKGYFNHCQALLMPTLLESFSGTYLEAMHFSLPILTSGLDFAREVCGDAALYFDPFDPRSIKDAILQLKNDNELSLKLAARGRERLKRYFISWDKIAGKVANQLAEIAK